MNIIESLQWRYATKKFDRNKIIPQDKIEVLKEAFNLTATSYGMQPVKLLVLSDKKRQEDLLPLSMNQQQIATASHVLILAGADINNVSINTYFDSVKQVRGTSEEILNPFRTYLLDNFSNKTELEKETFIKNQAYIALGNLLTVCALERIDACPLEGFEPKAYDEFFNLEEKGLKSLLVIPIGYRAEDDMFSTLKKVRKSIDESIIEL
jgi:nitroreductase